jgi:type I restriction enzyme S subunit
MKKYSEYKESGIEWLSEIPSDWNLCKLKHILEVKDGTHSTPKPIEPSEDAIPLITSKNVKNGIIDFTETTFISKEDHFEINKRSNVEKHDIIMPMIGTVGNPAIVQTDQPFSIKNVALLKNSPLVNIKYINYLFGSAFITTQFDLFSTGGVQNFVSLSILKTYSYLKLIFVIKT